MEVMMLEDAIKHAEEVAEENEKSLREWKECLNRGTVGWSDFTKEKVDTSITRCSKCAAEHRHLAEWLKELKEYRSIKDQIAFVKRNIRSENSDYLAGYISALSAVEGMIAEVEIAESEATE